MKSWMKDVVLDVGIYFVTCDISLFGLLSIQSIPEIIFSGAGVGSD